jgi:putative membrane protein
MMMGPMWMVLWSLLFVALVVAAGVLIWRTLPRDGRQQDRSAARDTLDERYARGELDRDEYEERRRTLDR